MNFKLIPCLTFNLIKMKKNITQPQIKEILEKGVEQIIDKKSLIKKLISGKKLRIKLGIDPTLPVLHLGNTIPLWKLRRFQDAGHQIVVIIGDFTARIGDPSDKTAMRQPLTRAQVEENMKDYKKQIGKILNVKKTKFVYNNTWLSKLSFWEILSLADCFTVGQMLERENFNKRYKENKLIGLHEFLYPLMQGYDSVAVQADVEIGGTDQTFNLLAGRVIQKKYGQKPQDIITLTLIEGTDGRKMSKSFGNIIAITDKPVDIFKKIMTMDDQLVIKYFHLCTPLLIKEINEIKKDNPNPYWAKSKLAEEIVSLYYGKEKAKTTREEFNKDFRKSKK